MSRQINHRELELEIGIPCRCDDYSQVKVAGYYLYNNDIVIAAWRGKDEFFLTARGPKSDLSEAIPLTSRYLVIGDLASVDERIFKTCVLQNKADVWLSIPDKLFISRLLVAGAIRIITIASDLPASLAQTPEYKQALLDKRVIEIIC